MAKTPDWEGFAREMFGMEDRGDWDIDVIREVAEQRGVLIRETWDEPCDHDRCVRAEAGEFPRDCLRLTSKRSDADRLREDANVEGLLEWLSDCGIPRELAEPRIALLVAAPRRPPRVRPDRQIVEDCLARMYEDGRNDLPTCDWISEAVERSISTKPSGDTIQHGTDADNDEEAR